MLEKNKLTWTCLHNKDLD